MAKFEVGDMWTVYQRVGLFLVTTNSTVKTNGRLVMGRGIALQARDRIPDLDLILGSAILAHPSYPIYGLVVRGNIGAFQVKYNYVDSADLRLIRLSTAMLDCWCSLFPERTIALNFPGIGNGRLPRDEVLPIISILPDQVTIWEYSSSRG